MPRGATRGLPRPRWVTLPVALVTPITGRGGLCVLLIHSRRVIYRYEGPAAALLYVLQVTRELSVDTKVGNQLLLDVFEPLPKI